MACVALQLDPVQHENPFVRWVFDMYLPETLSGAASSTVNVIHCEESTAAPLNIVLCTTVTVPARKQ